LEKQQYFSGTGRRKCAIAQVKLYPGAGPILVNGVDYEELFPRTEHRRTIQRALIVTENMGKFHAVIKTTGGGVSGQCGAISHGISRALLKSDEEYRRLLREHGLLTRDARVKERKKPGLKRARKAPQYTKR
jgi:small subunit ribosomal protein S9